MNQQQLDDIKSRVASEYEDDMVTPIWGANNEFCYYYSLRKACEDVEALLAEVERLEKENAEHVKYRTYF